MRQHRYGQPWSVDDTKELIRLVKEQNYSYNMLAKTFSTTRSAVSGKVMRLRDKGLLKR